MTGGNSGYRASYCEMGRKVAHWAPGILPGVVLPGEHAILLVIVVLHGYPVDDGLSTIIINWSHRVDGAIRSIYLSRV